MTFREYRLRMKAYNLRKLDTEYMASFFAWQNREVGAQKKKGKHKLEYVYRKFTDLFDHTGKEMMLLYGAKKKESKAMSGTKNYMRKKNNGQL